MHAFNVLITKVQPKTQLHYYYHHQTKCRRLGGVTCDKAVRCAQSMINVIKNGINPILKNYNYPELSLKISIDEGEIVVVVVQHAYDKSSQIDVLGYVLNVAAR